ncbi:phage baseplate protein [Streptomyces sp. 4N509B]|uniref:phage baseplate protein n=1 Tax=Streptomyces sp. 4N509B TaxID=3457413 RepID=UPI003FD5A4CE
MDGQARHRGRLDRRSVLALGGGAAAAAAVGGWWGAGRAAAAVPASARFDLTEPSYDLFRHKDLHEGTVQQSFSFDNVNRRLFVAQLRSGYDGTLGHLCVNQLAFDGTRIGHMHLTGFGHGVGFAAQGVGSATYLWTEVDANANGYGRRLARFRYAAGTTLSASSTSLTKYHPVAEASEHTCSVDPVHNRLVVRYHVSGVGKHIAVYDLARAAAGDFSQRLADFRMPSVPGTAQGYTAYGQYLYYLTGNAYSDDNPPPGNAELTTVDLNTGRVVQGPFRTEAGRTLTFREPEGLAIYRTAAGEPRLFLGFASGESGDRRSNLFYKNALV